MDDLYIRYYKPTNKHLINIDSITKNGDLLSYFYHSEETVQTINAKNRDEINVKADDPLTLVKTYIDNYYKLAYGIYNGTRFYGGPSSKQCEDTVSTYIKLFSTDFYNDFFPPTPVCTEE